MAKPFFYKVTAAEFLAAVAVVPETERGEWVLDLAVDMVKADRDDCKSDFAVKIIDEANVFQQKMSAAGSKGKKNRWPDKI